MAKSTKKTTTLKKSPVKKKSNKGWSAQFKIAMVGVLLVLLSPFYYKYVVRSVAFAWQWAKGIGETDPHYRSYKSFNIHIPDKYTIHGIDVSYAQGKIDWQKVKAMEEDSVRISFAFIKATEGVASADPYFRRNWREAPKAGIVCGAYHYFKPNKSGILQARFFLQNVKVEKGDLPVVVDIEELNGVSPVKMRQELSAFLKYIETKTTAKPIIYSSLNFYQEYLQGYYDGYNLWIANYHQHILKVKNDTHWQFWQHSNKASINGIHNVVDFDAFNGDSLAFKQLLVR